MAIFRVKSYSTITVGSGGRITIPQDMRDDLRIDDGDTLTVRLEESDGGQRQITVWKSQSGEGAG
ncbi:MAG: AbrB/MazE/SpoVT family DNA-binding domain-containing protein [Gemmatimonadota bacterium]|nr:AbrB/MazE/SpoVT family DNA-binding domain-containing protein [Gemmatimonadota bacterium]